MESGADADDSHDLCFNCCSRWEANDGKKRRSKSGHVGGIIISSASGLSMINYSEALAHLFELDSCGLELMVENLNVDNMALCDCCYEILAKIYTLRQDFRDLTDSSSRIFKLLNKSMLSNENDLGVPQSNDSYAHGNNTTTGSDDGIWEMKMEEHSDSDDEFIEETPIPMNSDNQEVQFVSGVRICVVDAHLTLSPSTITETNVVSPGGPLLRCPWCSKHVPQSIHKLHADACCNKNDAPAHGTPRRAVSPHRVTCPICKNPRIAEGVLRQHIKTHGSTEERDILLPPKVCCGEIFKSRRNLRRHQKSVVHRHKLMGDIPNPRMAECPQCGKFMAANNLRTHIWAVHERRTRLSSVCDICERPCHKPAILKMHRISHLSEEERMALPPDMLHELEKIQNAAALNRNRERQRMLSLNRKRSLSTCPECGKTLNSVVPNALQNHIDFVHRRQTRHICDICGKPNQSRYALGTHRTTHLGAEEKLLREAFVPRPLCAYCAETFQTEGTLRNHIARVHEKSTPRVTFACNKCEYKSNYKKSLNAHMRVHEIEEGDDYPYSCDKCSMKFKFIAEKKIHPPSCPAEAAQRPFPCIVDGCDRRSKYRHHLELHLNEFHGYGPEKAREMVYPGRPPLKRLQQKVGKKGKTKKRRKASEDD